MKKVNIENESYLAPSWQEMGEFTVQLAQNIKKQEKKFDRIIALATGGLGWVKQLQDLTQIPNLSSLQISFYNDINKTKSEPKIIQPLPISIVDENILVYDDVVDSGATIKLAKEYLSGQGAKSVEVASHFCKIHSPIKPNYCGDEIEGWIIFPHDTMEMINYLKKKWSHLKPEQIEENLTKIGIEPKILCSI